MVSPPAPNTGCHGSRFVVWFENSKTLQKLACHDRTQLVTLA
jgi:hypothetical protein